MLRGLESRSWRVEFRRPTLPGLLLLGAAVWLVGSSQAAPDPSPAPPLPEATGTSPLFRELDPKRSGIDFANTLQESARINHFTYEYAYNGGGVAIGDVDGDGLPDIYLTGNMVDDRLYRNRGDLRFESVPLPPAASARAGWSTGVTMADVNQDGWLDIYVSRSGWLRRHRLRNLLFVNNGDLTFSEKAGEYGIADAGHSTQASFFDYDGDGDLDLYVANHPRRFHEPAHAAIEKTREPPPRERDRLYRNDGASFSDVSDEAGIVNYAHSLGLVTVDIDNDGWTDVYVSNDYQDPDFYYRNNGDGSFTDITKKAMRHTAKSSMGVDAADFDNDGWTDLFAVEMVAEDNYRQKTNMAPMDPATFWKEVSAGLGYQYMHNVLQLNNRNDSFSEIAYLAGVATTDWSWAPLFADFDNDGLLDIFVTNGLHRDMLDKDYKKKVTSLKAKGTPLHEIVVEAPVTHIPNYAFRNMGDLRFEKVTASWGLDREVNSNGAAYADLDRDGDLDLVINNMDAPASIYRNQLSEMDGNASLRVRLEGAPTNRNGVGAKVTVVADGGEQVRELAPTRGYQSSVEPVLHFGLGSLTEAEEVRVRWPDGREQVIGPVPAGEVVLAHRDEASAAARRPPTPRATFAAIEAPWDRGFRHRETPHDDYAKQLLLPHKLSQEGPGIAVGDANGDGMDDFYIGGAAGQSGSLYLQRADGRFGAAPVPAFLADRDSEDMGALFFDADSDGDLDLYVSSGSYEFGADDPRLQDRLYRNDGRGGFLRASEALPGLRVSSSAVLAADYDGDEDLDLFVGGRLEPGRYPAPGTSVLLRNDGGVFEDAAPEALKKVGMVTAGLWSDYDDDGDPDLIVVGEWMPITIFRNRDGKLSRVADDALFGDGTSDADTKGWWNSISGGDFDNDGDTDYVLGNLGLNSKNRASARYPFTIYADDFDESGSYDIVLGYYDEGVEHPVRGFQCSSEQVPALTEEISSYAEFASLEIGGVYGAESLRESLHLEALTFASSYLENRGGRFAMRALPVEAQFGPTDGILVEDFDLDACLDALLVGNRYPVEVETGRYDAHNGVFLLGDCSGGFRAVRGAESGFFVAGDAQALALVRVERGNRALVVVARNYDEALAFELRKSAERLAWRHPEPGRSSSMLDVPGGGKRKVEWYLGAGYLSQTTSGAMLAAE